MTQSFVTWLLKKFFRSEKLLGYKSRPADQQGGFVTWLLKNILGTKAALVITRAAL
jgi:hypothetical protein